MATVGPDRQGRRRTGRERLTRLAVGAAIVLSAISLASQTAPNSAAKVLSAESFVLMDASGRRRAALAVRADGTPALGILDEAGKVRAALAMREDGAPSLGLVDKDGKTRAELALRPDGTPTLGLADTDGRTHVELSLRSDGSPSLAFADKRGKTRVVLIVRANGALTLALADPSGKTSWPCGPMALRTWPLRRKTRRPASVWGCQGTAPRCWVSTIGKATRGPNSAWWAMPGLGSPFFMNRGGSCGARRSGPCSSYRRRAAGNELDRDGWRGDPFDLEPGRKPSVPGCTCRVRVPSRVPPRSNRATRGVMPNESRAQGLPRSSSWNTINTRTRAVRLASPRTQLVINSSSCRARTAPAASPRIANVTRKARASRPHRSRR